MENPWVFQQFGAHERHPRGTPGAPQGVFQVLPKSLKTIGFSTNLVKIIKNQMFFNGFGLNHLGRTSGTPGAPQAHPRGTPRARHGRPLPDIGDHIMGEEGGPAPPRPWPIYAYMYLYLLTFTYAWIYLLILTELLYNF